MIRALAILLLLTGAARAQNTLCPPISFQSFGFPLKAPLQFATYDIVSFTGTPAGLLTVQQQGGKIDTYLGVPQSVATGFQTSTNQMQYYTSRIQSAYHELLLYTGSKCPVGYVNGGVQWSR